MNIRFVCHKIISIDISFVNFKNNFTTKGTKESQKLMKKVLSYIIIWAFKDTKAKFLFYKNFCVTFVPFVVFHFWLCKKDNRILLLAISPDYHAPISSKNIVPHSVPSNLLSGQKPGFLSCSFRYRTLVAGKVSSARTITFPNEAGGTCFLFAKSW